MKSLSKKLISAQLLAVLRVVNPVAVGEGKPEVFFRQSERAIDMQLGNEPLYLGTGRWNCPSEPPDVECSPCRVSFHIENRGRSEVKLAPL